jgi:hypothetical protein
MSGQKSERKIFRRRRTGCAGLCFAILFFVVLSLLALLVPVVEFVDDEGKARISFRARLGDAFSTAYIHSVQLCPVVDEYRVSGNALWLWEERTQSTNAGLPTEAPRLGRFIHTPPWYRYIGGRHRFETVRLRVGTAEIGKNVLFLPNGSRVDLYGRFAGSVLTLRLRR